MFRLELRDHAGSVAKKHGLEIEFIKKKNFRKEQRIRSIVEQRGDAPGLVHIFSAVESCTAFKPWHDKTTHKTSLKPVPGKCLHYYFYFILPDLGLCYLRVPAWAPFRLQFYFNAHNELARKLDKKNIGYTMLDNAFVAIDDLDLFRIITRGEFTISGFRNSELRNHLPGKSAGKISRMIKQLRKHGLIKKSQELLQVLSHRSRTTHHRHRTQAARDVHHPIASRTPQ